MESFQELDLNPRILNILKELGFEMPTPIQALSLPSSLKGHDIQGEASTGMGKTLAYVLPLLQALQSKRSYTSLVLVPTRELVPQVGAVIESFRKAGLRVSWTGLAGGSSVVLQLRRLKKHQQIIVGTPGRVYDHLSRGSIKMDRIDAFVLDEADRMLDMGFAPQIKKIRSFFMGAKPQTLFFSATYPPSVKKFVREILIDPVFVKAVSKDIVKPDIKQEAALMKQNEKFELLVDQVKKREGSVIVFSQTRKSTQQLATRLHDHGLGVSPIHGDLSQGMRNRTIRNFRDGKTRILVATDVAARGLDIDHINHVINFDIPQRAEDYVHRIGRTGRAGRKGEAFSFVTAHDAQVWNEIRDIVKDQCETELPAFFPKGAKSKGFGGGGRSRRRSGGRGSFGGGGRRNSRRSRSDRGEASVFGEKKSSKRSFKKADGASSESSSSRGRSSSKKANSSRFRKKDSSSGFKGGAKGKRGGRPFNKRASNKGNSQQARAKA